MARHVIPLRSTYQIASSSSRRLYFSGRPIADGFGKIASISPHALSSKSLGYGFRVFIPPAYPVILTFKTLSQHCSFPYPTGRSLTSRRKVLVQEAPGASVIGKRCRKTVPW